MEEVSPLEKLSVPLHLPAKTPFSPLLHISGNLMTDWWPALDQQMWWCFFHFERGQSQKSSRETSAGVLDMTMSSIIGASVRREARREHSGKQRNHHNHHIIASRNGRHISRDLQTVAREQSVLCMRSCGAWTYSSPSGMTTQFTFWLHVASRGRDAAKHMWQISAGGPAEFQDSPAPHSLHYACLCTTQNLPGQVKIICSGSKMKHFVRQLQMYLSNLFFSSAF